MHGPSFAVRQVCKKYLAHGKDVFWVFMDLEKAYDMIDRCRISQYHMTFNCLHSASGTILRTLDIFDVVGVEVIKSRDNVFYWSKLLSPFLFSTVFPLFSLSMGWYYRAGDLGLIGCQSLSLSLALPNFFK